MRKIKKMYLIKPKNLTESFDNCFSDVEESGIDSTNHIIKNVCLFGTPKSSNGRIYTEKAIGAIANLAEGSKCFLDHPSKSEIKERDGVRSVKDFAGIFEAAYKKGDKVFANLRVREAFFPLFKDIALMNPKGTGLSINARVKVFQGEDGMESVADVDLLRSTDLVASAATTQNLWESAPEVETEEQELNNLCESVEDKVKEKFDSQIANEGVLQNQLDNRKIRNEIDQVSYLAQDLINGILMDDKLSVADKKKKVMNVFNDLDSEVTKRLKSIKESMKMELTLDMLKKDHKDLVQAILDEFKQSSELVDIRKKLDVATQTITDLKSQIEDQTKKIGDKEKEVEDLKSDKLNLQAKLDEKEVAEKLSEKKVMINKAVQEAKLPKEAVTDIFMETLMNVEEKKGAEDKVITVEEQVKKLIEDRKALVNKNSGKVRNAGDEFVDNLTEQLDENGNPKKKDIKESTEDFLKDIK